MTQGEFRYRIDVLLGNGFGSAPCRVGSGRTQPDQIGPQAIDAVRAAILAAQPEGVLPLK